MKEFATALNIEPAELIGGAASVAIEHQQVATISDLPSSVLFQIMEGCIDLKNQVRVILINRLDSYDKISSHEL